MAMIINHFAVMYFLHSVVYDNLKDMLFCLMANTFVKMKDVSAILCMWP